jgi:hypothetical protein
MFQPKWLNSGILLGLFQLFSLKKRSDSQPSSAIAYGLRHLSVEELQSSLDY